MNSKHLEIAKKVLQEEAQALIAFSERLGQSLHDVIELILCCKGKVVLTGVGKSGFVARKIASTLSSLGTPSIFLHPTEAYHGDLGVLSSNDVCIAISNSGNTDELLRLVPSLKLLGIPLVSVCTSAKSELGQVSDLVLETGLQKEACSLNLAPTTSSTVTMALGDAIAVALVNAKGFTEREFAFFHPGGTLGRKLLLRVSDIMLSRDKVGVAKPKDGIKTLVDQLGVSNLGLVAITDSEEKLVGVITDGDLRRAVQRGNIDRCTAEMLMTPSPKVIGKDKLVTEAVYLGQKFRIKALLVTASDNQFEGAINLHDAMKERLF